MEISGMKIAILAAAYPPSIRGGGEISTQILAESLHQEGASVHVLSCAATQQCYIENGVHIQTIRSPNINWNFSPDRNLAQKLFWHLAENYNPVARRAIARFLRQIKPDLLVTSTIENFGAEAWRTPAQLGIKTVHILRSYYPMCHRGTAFKGGRNCSGSCTDCLLLSAGRRRASQLVNGIIGLNHATLDQHLMGGLFRHAIRTVLPDPVSTPKTIVTASTRRSDLVFGYLGFLTKNKGVELIADTLRAKPMLANTQVRIAGTGEPSYVEALKARFAGLNAEFVGWKNNEEFLKEIDFLIVPSVFREPFGRIVAEAFTSGVPVIGSNTGGIGEMVIPEFNGFRFNPGDPLSLAAAIVAARDTTADSYHRISKNALETAKKFTGEAVAKNNLLFFQTVLAEKVPPGTNWLPPSNSRLETSPTPVDQTSVADLVA
jgi:glycosyltransferase involved in cell wall biosynthesis